MNSFNVVGQILFVSSKEGVRDFCNTFNVEADKFNMQVVIDDTLTDCSGMFEGMSGFNKFVIIPKNCVKCNSMFEGCLSFNKPVAIPESVRYAASMFKDCVSLNKIVTLPDKLTEYHYMFENCNSLKAQIKIPKDADGINMFYGCPGEYDSYTYTYRFNDDDNRLTIEDLEKDAMLLMKVMEQYADYKTWFAYKFPHGAKDILAIEKALKVSITI